MTPSRPTPTSAQRTLVPITELAEALLATRDRSTDAAVQGTAARSGEVLLLAFDAQEERLDATVGVPAGRGLAVVFASLRGKHSRGRSPNVLRRYTTRWFFPPGFALQTGQP